MVESRYKPRAEHAGIHGNPESNNRQALSHGQTRVSGDFLTTQYPYYHQQKRRRWGSYNHSKQATCSKQTAGSPEAKRIQLSPTNLVTLKSHWPALAVKLNILHKATCENWTMRGKFTGPIFLWYGDIYICRDPTECANPSLILP